MTAPRAIATLLATLGLLLAIGGHHARAQAGVPAPWNTPWNTPGGSVPLAPASSSTPPTYCAAAAATPRPPETDADAQVAAAGWWLNGGYLSGWGTTVVFAASGYGGMCQPDNNQEFVFIDGVFVGTLAPFTLGPEEGPPRVYLSGPDSVSATFPVYATRDPLCCPSSMADVQYGIDGSSGAPVLTVLSVNTYPTGR